MAYNKEYYEKNKESYLRRQKEYYEQNKENRLEYFKQWYEENKEKKKEYQRKYNKVNYQKEEVRLARIEYQRNYRRKKQLIKILEQLRKNMKTTSADFVSSDRIIGDSDLLYGYSISREELERRNALANEIITEQLSLNELLQLEKLINRLNFHYQLPDNTLNDLTYAIRYVRNKQVENKENGNK